MPTVGRANRRRFLSRPGDRQQVAFPRHDVSPRRAVGVVALPRGPPVRDCSSARVRLCPLPTECPGQRARYHPACRQSCGGILPRRRRAIRLSGRSYGRREEQSATQSVCEVWPLPPPPTADRPTDRRVATSNRQIYTFIYHITS
jgi:hypothetical protein